MTVHRQTAPLQAVKCERSEHCTHFIWGLLMRLEWACRWRHLTAQFDRLTNCFLIDYPLNVEELSKTGRTLEGEADFRDHGTASECRASRSASLGVVWNYQASSENDLGFSLYWEVQVICPYLPYLFVWLFLFYISWFDKYAEGPTCHKISIRVADMMFQVILCGNIFKKETAFIVYTFPCTNDAGPRYILDGGGVLESLVSKTPKPFTLSK